MTCGETRLTLAARMESHGLPGEIHISEAMADKLKEKHLLAQRGWVEVKGKGLLQTFWVKQKESRRGPKSTVNSLRTLFKSLPLVHLKVSSTRSHQNLRLSSQNHQSLQKKEAKWAKRYQKKRKIPKRVKNNFHSRDLTVQRVRFSVDTGQKVLGKSKEPLVKFATHVNRCLESVLI